VTYDANNHLNLPSAWTDWPLAESTNLLYLETAYGGILPNSYIGIQQPQSTGGATPIDTCPVIEVLGADVGSRSAMASAAAPRRSLSQRLSPGAVGHLRLSTIRQVAFYTQSEPLPMADYPRHQTRGRKQTRPRRLLPRLHDGQHLILTGNRYDVPGTAASELITLQDVTIELGLTVLTLVDNLTNTYIRSSVTLNANVALATMARRFMSPSAMATPPRCSSPLRSNRRP